MTQQEIYEAIQALKLKIEQSEDLPKRIKSFTVTDLERILGRIKPAQKFAKRSFVKAEPVKVVTTKPAQVAVLDSDPMNPESPAILDPAPDQDQDVPSAFELASNVSPKKNRRKSSDNDQD